MAAANNKEALSIRGLRKFDHVWIYIELLSGLRNLYLSCIFLFIFLVLI